MATASGTLPPTKVLYVRNIPETVPESELVQYCSPFGEVTSTLILKEKGHGFIEFRDMDAAAACCNYFTQNPLVVCSHYESTHLRIAPGLSYRVCLQPEAGDYP
jgi:RNA recognition motif-containing protein